MRIKFLSSPGHDRMGQATDKALRNAVPGTLARRRPLARQALHMGVYCSTEEVRRPRLERRPSSRAPQGGVAAGARQQRQLHW